MYLYCVIYKDSNEMYINKECIQKAKSRLESGLFDSKMCRLFEIS